MFLIIYCGIFHDVNHKCCKQEGINESKVIVTIGIGVYGHAVDNCSPLKHIKLGIKIFGRLNTLNKLFDPPSAHQELIYLFR